MSSPRPPLRRPGLALLLAISALACSDRPGPTQPALERTTRFSTRTYYVAADLVEWNYAPSGANRLANAPFTEEEEIWAVQSPTHIGPVYIKALYREYTDATFSTLKPRPAEWQHLGALGPLVRGQVGDTIRIIFRNNADRPYSVHPHGVFYDKGSEGAPYDDGDGSDAGDMIEPGETHEYVWAIPERAGPGPSDGSSIVWMYHSHVDEPKDANSGLVGPIIVTRAGQAREDGSPRDVDREFVNLFMIYDENSSWYIDDNISAAVARDPSFSLGDDFEESNLKHAINGWIYGNFPDGPSGLSMSMRLGDRVRWYLLGMGTEVDLHTPHWHGQSLLWMGMRTDVVELLPGSMRVADMEPDNPGTWLYHCHVNDHITAGMVARFEVVR